MEIRDEIRLSKGDTLPKKSSLLDFDQNKHRNKLSIHFFYFSSILLSVKGIGRVSPMKSKSKVTDKSDSPKIIKESDKAPVVKEKPADVIEKSAVDKKDNPKVTSKVLKYKRKTELPKDRE
ncbi:hypothetical protein Tco_1250967 [Tanacetum coccineum]